MENLKHLATFAAHAKEQLFSNMAALNTMSKVENPTQEDLDKAEALTGKVGALSNQMQNFASMQQKWQQAKPTEDLGFIPKGTSKLDATSAAPLLKMLLETLDKMPKDAVDEISQADLRDIEQKKHEEERKQMRVNVGADGKMTH